MGPLRLCLVLHKLVMKIGTHNANLLANCWFIDDGCVVGTHLSTLQQLVS